MDIITQINREDEQEDAQLNAYADKGKKRMKKVQQLVSFALSH